MLEQHIRQKLQKKPLLLMTHIVIGYPSFRESWALARSMVDAGVDLMELQIPFSEPMADGPVILKANQDALAAGATVAKCVEFARELAQQVPIPLLFMSYYNILFKHGVQRFAADMKRVGISGAIVPDLPLEEGADYASAMAAEGLAPVRASVAHSQYTRMAWRSGTGSQRTRTSSNVSGWHSGISAEAIFAPCSPATSAMTSASPLGRRRSTISG